MAEKLPVITEKLAKNTGASALRELLTSIWREEAAAGVPVIEAFLSSQNLWRGVNSTSVAET